MEQTAREEILQKLKVGPEREVPPRPAMPPLNELSWNREQLIEKFAENLVAQTGIFYRVKSCNEAVDTLTEIAASERLRKVAVSTDDVIVSLNLPDWGKKNHIEVVTTEDFKDRDAFKLAVFEQAQAGITGADYAVAESGTLCLIHDKNQPRLVSLAPIMHIVIVPAERLHPVYESVTEKIYGGTGKIPSHTTFITGPSMTGDIQGVPFKGMHGPKKLTVILIG